MGLFSKRKAEPLVYAEVERTVHVPAGFDDVAAHLAAYSELWSPKHAQQHEVSVGVAGGWTAIRLPAAVHPWQLHNLAYWMLDCPGVDAAHDVLAESAAGPDHPGYRLVRDPDIADALSGWDDAGTGWTVRIPLNQIVRGDDVPVSRAITTPSGYQDWRAVPVLLEDPGRGMNERNESTHPSRASLARADIGVY